VRLRQVAPIHETEAALLRGVGDFHADTNGFTALGMDSDLGGGSRGASVQQPKTPEEESGNRGIGESGTPEDVTSPSLRFPVSSFLRILLLS
jgi:hypothetical protein